MKAAPPASVIEPRLVQALVGSMATDEFAPIVMTLEAVVVKVVVLDGDASSPLATSIVPLLVNVVGLMMSCAASAWRRSCRCW